MCFVLVRLLSEDIPDLKALFSCTAFTNCTYERLNLNRAAFGLFGVYQQHVSIFFILFSAGEKKKIHCLGIFLTCLPPTLKHLRIMECVSRFLSYVMFSHGEECRILTYEFLG